MQSPEASRKAGDGGMSLGGRGEERGIALRDGRAKSG